MTYSHPPRTRLQVPPLLPFERARRDSKRAHVALHPGTFLATQMVIEAGIAPPGTAAEGVDAVLSVIERALRGETGKYYEHGHAQRLTVVVFIRGAIP